MGKASSSRTRTCHTTYEVVAVVQLLLLLLVVTGTMLSRARRLIGETQEYPLAVVSTHRHPQHSSTTQQCPVLIFHPKYAQQ